MVEAAASALAVEAYKDGKSMFGYISRKFNYASAFQDNYQKLTQEADKLYARRVDVEAEINANKTKRASEECKVWIRIVGEILAKVDGLKGKYEKETERGSGFLRLLSRSNLSKSMAKMSEEVHAHLLEGRLENGFLVDRPPDHVRILDAPTTADKPSMHWAVEKILDFLRDENVKSVGLWGMVGTGKTTVMRNLNNSEQVGQMFDIVIWVSVSRSWSVGKLQKVIGQRLHLSLDGASDPDEAAHRISSELEDKRYLLLLDEVWDSIDLGKIGIRDNKKDSKVVLAGRSNICFRRIVDELVNMTRLSETDAWKIFEENVGRSVLTDPGIKPIAELVVKECVRLPLFIDLVAQAFKNKEGVPLWRDELRKLRLWFSGNDEGRDEGMKEVLKFLRYCYDNLDSDSKRVCFLYGALFPEDCEIFVDYLLECWIAERYTDDLEFRGARDQGRGILQDLVSASLFEMSEKKNHVRMNKVLRSMALRISSKIMIIRF